MSQGDFKDFLDRLEQELGTLPHYHQLAFGASCCERAYPNYVVFFQLSRWGGPAALRASLDRVWDFIEGAPRALDDLAELERKSEAITPDLDDFSTPDIDVQAAAAQEAAFMVRVLLQFCRDKEVSHPLSIAIFAQDTIDMYIQVIERIDAADPQLEAKIAEHPLMIQEIEKQEYDLLRLAEIKTRAELQAFRRHATSTRVSNIGLAPQP